MRSNKLLLFGQIEHAAILIRGKLMQETEFFYLTTFTTLATTHVLIHKSSKLISSYMIISVTFISVSYN